MLRGDVSASEDEEEEPLLVLKKDFISGEELAGGEVWKTRPCSDGRRSRPAEEIPTRSSAIAVASPESDDMRRNGSDQFEWDFRLILYIHATNTFS